MSKSNALQPSNEIQSPRFLRGMSKSEALGCAKFLTVFLQDATEAMAVQDITSKANSYGLYLCFEHLLDCLDIARGEFDPFMAKVSNHRDFTKLEDKE